MIRFSPRFQIFVTLLTVSWLLPSCDEAELDGVDVDTDAHESGRDSEMSDVSSNRMDATDQVMWRLTPQEIDVDDGMERAPNPVRLAGPDDLPPDDGAVDPGLELDPRSLYENAQQDRSWRASDGARYEAMLVLEDGTAFGQIGEAAVATRPQESNRHGAFAGYDDFPGTLKVVGGDDVLGAEDRDPSGPRDFISHDADPLPAILGGSLSQDRRIRVSSLASMTQYPERTMGAINQTQSAGFTGCTATKIGPRALLTASHCVLDADGNWTTSGWFHPGQTNASHPNTSGTAVRWSGVYARDWRLGRQYEYAILYLQDRGDSYALGWLGVAWWNSSGSYQGILARVLGYPQKSSGSWNRKCKASTLANDNCDGWMYRDSAYLGSEAYIGSGQLQYDLDTSAAQSGSSVLTKLGSGDWVTLGAHWGCSDCTYRNRSSRFRTKMWNDVCSWIAAVPSGWGSHPICK